MSEVFPMTLSVSGSNVYELGQTITPRISWELHKESAIIIPDRVQIDGVDIDRPESGVWSPASPITSSRTYTIKVWSDGASYVGSVNIRFKLKKYWGVISEPNQAIDVYGLFSTWADSWKLSGTTFNCSGGFYPVYIIPATLYPGELDFQVWVGGLRSTDFTITRRTLTNVSGHKDEYVVCVLNRIQTGMLNIKFDN